MTTKKQRPARREAGLDRCRVSLARSVAQATASHVMRRFLDKSKIPTPLPPDPPGEPDSDEGRTE